MRVREKCFHATAVNVDKIIVSVRLTKIRGVAAKKLAKEDERTIRRRSLASLHVSSAYAAQASCNLRSGAPNQASHRRGTGCSANRAQAIPCSSPSLVWVQAGVWPVWVQLPAHGATAAERRGQCQCDACVAGEAQEGVRTKVNASGSGLAWALCS